MVSGGYLHRWNTEVLVSCRRADRYHPTLWPQRKASVGPMHGGKCSAYFLFLFLEKSIGVLLSPVDHKGNWGWGWPALILPRTEWYLLRGWDERSSGFGIILKARWHWKCPSFFLLILLLSPLKLHKLCFVLPIAWKMEEEHGCKGEHISAPGFFLHSLNAEQMAVQTPWAHLWASKRRWRQRLAIPSYLRCVHL